MSTENPTHKEIDDRLKRGEMRFSLIEEKLDLLLEAVKPIPQMQVDLGRTKELVEIADTVSHGAKYLKWLAGVAAALLALGAFIKHGIASIIGGAS